MKRHNWILLNVLLCCLVAGIHLWCNRWYLDKEKCFEHYKEVIHLTEGILIGETENGIRIHRVVYHKENDTFSVLELEKMMMFTRFGNSYQGIPFADSDLGAFGVMFHQCSESSEMIVVFQRYNQQVEKVEIACKDGQVLVIDQWDQNFCVYSTVEYLRPMSGVYRSYDALGNIIDEMRWG